MKSSNLFTVVGTSVRNGKSRLRVSAGKASFRGRVLLKTGNTNVNLFDLPHPMSKQDAADWYNSNISQGIVPSFQS